MIGGPNGAGKTTTALSLMPADIDCYEYVNAEVVDGCTR
jgi:predicted ABC-type ATPase